MTDMTECHDVAAAPHVVVVVGLDLGNLSEQILRVARDLSPDKPDTTLHLVHVVSVEPASLEARVQERAQMDSARHELHRLWSCILSQSQARCMIHTPIGGVVEHLVRIADQLSADLLVIGAGGRAKRTLGESVAARVAKTASCSVFAVRERHDTLRSAMHIPAGRGAEGAGLTWWDDHPAESGATRSGRASS